MCTSQREMSTSLMLPADRCRNGDLVPGRCLSILVSSTRQRGGMLLLVAGTAFRERFVMPPRCEKRAGSSTSENLLCLFYSAAIDDVKAMTTA